MSDVLHRPRWYQGATLAERVAVLRRPTAGSAPPAPIDVARAARRLARWRSRAPLDRADVFGQMLAAAGLTEQELLQLLGEPAEALRARFEAPPGWLDQLARIFAGERPASPDSEASAPLAGSANARFAAPLAPFIAGGCARLKQGVERICELDGRAPFAPESAVALCTPHLVDRLDLMLIRTMVLEVNVARLEDKLAGETAEERFRCFMARLGERGAMLDLLSEYPVLARQVISHVATWVDTCLELFTRLGRDFPEICRVFSPDREPGGLAACRFGAGDPHRGGRAVAILTFTSGLRVVYKPRPLSADIHFQQLLRWLNDRGASPPFRALEILDCEDHGWVELAARRDCTSVEEVSRFYQRQGGYLALMYALNATDLHFENIVAAGEHPVIVDLESLFHPHFISESTGGSAEAAARAKADSVLRVGLLPNRAWSSGDSEGIDFSGLGSAAGQLTPRAAQVWEGAGTDAMRMMRKRIEVRGSANLPTLNGADVHVLDHGEAIVAGFDRVYRLLLAHRAELLAADGPLARFAEDEVRVILRPTHLYNLFYRESYHPDLLRDALDRDRFFDKLWVTTDIAPYLCRLIPFERADLWQGDIPMFTSRPGTRDIWSSTGERIADFFPSTGMSLTVRRLARLDEDDLKRQTWFVRASLTALGAGAAGARMPSYPLSEAGAPATRTRLLEAACTLGDRLAALAFRGPGDASWIGLAPVGERYWGLAPLRVDLYSGLAGVALFLAHLGDTTGEARFSELARAALATLRHHVAQGGPAAVRSFGAFGDWGGAVHALAHLGSLWGEQALLDEAEALLSRAPKLLSEDHYFDLLKGAAGGIAICLGLHRIRPSAGAMALAVRCGEHLLASARPMARGIGWVTPLGPAPLTGFLHGTAGIAWALFALAAQTGEPRFREAALAALEYERSQFSAEAGNWRDLREVSAPSGFMTAFCHGAPGIGLGRALTLPYNDTAEVRAELRAAMRTTLAAGFGGSHCLCHGDLGNLECLGLGAEALGDAELSLQRDRLAAVVLAGIERHGVLCGVPSGVETPGLMTGLAGVGHGLLRLAEPRRVPAILTLAPPPAGRRARAETDS